MNIYQHLSQQTLAIFIIPKIYLTGPPSALPLPARCRGAHDFDRSNQSIFIMVLPLFSISVEDMEFHGMNVSTVDVIISILL